MKENEDIRFFKGLLNGLGISILLWAGILSVLYKAFR
jgi:hypothetical protein